MKKTNLHLWLFAALVCGLSLSVTSCKDDDEPSEEEKAQQAQEQQEKENTAFNVLDYLADLSNAPEDYLTGSYEPTIGVADGSDANTRIMNTNDMETTAMRFSDLIDGSIDEETQTYTWSDDKVGTMTYTKTNDGKSWATVDVSIKQIPHLQKIIFRSPEQADNNGKFKGTAYYRFGDVVKKANADGNDEFWICVRPCFGPEGKEDSHWVTINALPKKNIYSYHSNTNNIDYALPTGIGDNHEHSQNFAEMLFAIFFPEEWQTNIINNPYKGISNKGITMFHDFDKSNLMYHNKSFWKRVQKAWTDSNALTNANGNPSGLSLLRTLFGTDGTAEYIKTMLKSNDGLNLLTNGKSWATGNSPTLYRYRFVNGEGKKSNMHEEPIKGGILHNYHSVSAEVINANIKLNCIKDYSTVTPGWKVPKFFGTENKHYIIRHAKGAELSTDKKENAKKPLTGVTEVYTYNKYYSITNLDDTPEIAEDYGEYGAIPPGTILKDEEGCHWLCYAAWADIPGSFTTKDHKARFVSLEGIKSQYEELEHTRAAYIIENEEELLPFEEAPVCAVSMAFFSNPYGDNAKAPYPEVREQINKAFNINIADWTTRRDSALNLNGQSFIGNLYSINVAYYHEDYAGQAPYLRCVIDASGLGGDRDKLPKGWIYPRLRFFTKYSHNKNRTLMLYDPFTGYSNVTPVPADEFSSAKRSDTGKRDGNFGVFDEYSATYNAELYNKEPTRYVTPYWEKVFVLRYMELEDPSGDIKSSYNGKKFEVVYKPKSDAEQLLRILGAQFWLSRGHNPGNFDWCTMDGKKFELGYYTSNASWPTIDDENNM